MSVPRSVGVGSRSGDTFTMCLQRFARQGSDPFDWVRGLGALPWWDPPARHHLLALNTALDVSNSVFEA